MLHNVGDQHITALQASFQYSDTFNITNDITVKQYGGVIDKQNAIEIVVSEVFYNHFFCLSKQKLIWSDRMSEQRRPMPKTVDGNKPLNQQICII